MDKSCKVGGRPCKRIRSGARPNTVKLFAFTCSLWLAACHLRARIQYQNFLILVLLDKK
jgi:hypothetical protein